MIWAASGVTFLATAVVVVAIFYAFSVGTLPITERLGRLWPTPRTEPESGFRTRQSERVQRVLTDVGKLLPASTKDLSHSHRLMVRAGYRRPEAVMAMRGMKLLLPLGLLALVYFTSFYRQNPFFILGFSAIAGYLLPELWLTSRVRRRQHRIRLALPDALDLLVVCVEAGLALDQALLRVSQELKIAHPELCEELDLVNAEMRVGRARIDALRELAARTGVEDIKALVAMLIQTDRFGTSVARSLRVHSDDLRVKRRQRAEEAAAKTTVKMVPPLVFFIFPALFVVILGPAVISIVRQFFPILQK
jgi:tight adherence protein C